MQTTKVIDGTQYDYPLYLVRAGEGWQVRVPLHESVYFADRSFGGTFGAHQQAMQHLKAAYGIKYLARPFATREQQTKQTPTGIPGVFLFKKDRNGRKREYQLQVRVPKMPIRTVYVGTDATWQDRINDKLEVARGIREHLLREAHAP